MAKVIKVSVLNEAALLKLMREKDPRALAVLPKLEDHDRSVWSGSGPRGDKAFHGVLSADLAALLANVPGKCEITAGADETGAPEVHFREYTDTGDDKPKKPIAGV